MGGAKARQGEGTLRRELGLWDSVAVVVGAIVGVGIFFTPSRVVALSGSGAAAMTTWVVGGLAAMTGALTFAALGARFPRNGAQYVALREVYGPALGFVYVVCNATAIQAGAIALIGLLCVYNTAEALGLGPLSPLASAGGAGLYIVVLSVANMVGVRWGKRVQNATALAKVATLVIITVTAALFSEGQAPSAQMEMSGETGFVVGVVAGLVPVMFTFGGWQQVLWLGGEVKDPARTIPRSVVLGVAGVVVIYVSVNAAYLMLLGAAEVAGSTALAADAVGSVVGDVGGRLVAAGVAISAFGVLNAQLLSGPRLVLELARDGRFFPVFGRIHPRAGTPIAAIALLGGVALVILFAAGSDGISAIDRILNGVVLVDGLFFALTGLAVPLLVLRGRGDGMISTLGLASACVFVLVELGVVAGTWLDASVRDASWVGLCWIAAATLLYAIRFRR